MENLEEKYKSQASKTKRADEKVRPILQRMKDDLNLGEYEEASRVYKDDDGQWYFEIADRLEEFKQQFKERQENQKKEEKKAEKRAEEIRKEEAEQETYLESLFDKVKSFFGLNEDTDNESQSE
jgi:hypothetical protein